MNFPGRGNNNCKDPKARRSSRVLRSRKDAHVAEVENTRRIVGQDVVREEGRDHILGDTVSQSKDPALYSKRSPKSLQVFKLGRDIV